MTANIEQILGAKIHALPYKAQTQVLAFIESLEHNPEASNEAQAKPELSDEEKYTLRMRLIGIASGPSDLSERVDEILAVGANREEGWSLP